MCAAGKLQYTGAPTGGFSTNTEYPIVAVAVDSGAVQIVVVDDNGDLQAVAASAANFSVTELYAPTKVV